MRHGELVCDIPVSRKVVSDILPAQADAAASRPHGSNQMKTLLVLLGAIVGGIVGHFLAHWLVHQNFYGMIIPGAFVGLGAGISRSRSLLVPIACSILALAAGFLTEWIARPFVDDHTFGDFLAHLGDRQPITFIMIAIGTLVGFWIPFQRRREKTS
jgi:hypothetical protein